MRSRHCAGAGGWRSPQRLGKPFPTPGLRPRECPPPSPPASPTPLPWCGLERALGASPRLHGLGFGKGWRAAEAFPRVCGKSGSGKVFQSSQQRLPRSPLRGEETAASAPVSPPPAQSSGLACWERPGFPAGRPSSPGRKPQLTQAAPKAEAARPNCSGRTAAPTPGACTGAQAVHRGGGPAKALRASQSHGLLHLPSRFFSLGPGSPGQLSACGGPPGSQATRSVPQPPTPSQFLPSPTTRRKGACPVSATPLMNINNRACALFRVLRRGGQPESRLLDRRSGSLREPGGHASLCYLQPAGELGSGFFFSSPPSPAFHAADPKGNKRLRIIII